MHDIGKPGRTRVEGERITSPGHAALGARMARKLLWKAGVSFETREHAVSLVRHHALPIWATRRDDGERATILASQTLRCDLLALLAEADIRGRQADDLPGLLEGVELFTELCREQRCWRGPRVFSSTHARFLYARKRWPHVDFQPHEDFGSDVVLMSGLPGAGKDHWLRARANDRPTVSLDAIRKELGLSATDNQGRVVQEARSRARKYLRRGAPFAWNATNVSRRIREACIGLFADYDAHIRIIYVEASPDRLQRQNRERGEAVPDAVLHRLLDRWQIPEPFEAHLGGVLDRRRFDPEIRWLSGAIGTPPPEEIYLERKFGDAYRDWL